MAVNPTAKIIFQNGMLRPEITLSEDVVIKLGVSTGGAYLKPTRVSQLSSVLGFLHGPLVASGAHQVDYSGPCYLMRIRASILGTIGSVTKVPAAGSVGSLTMGLMSYTLHAQVAGGAALNVTTGWIKAPAPLPVKIVSGAGTVAHNQTFTYYDEAGDVKIAVVAIAGAGTVFTTFEAAQVISVVTNVDPVGTQDWSSEFTGPQDRYDVQIKAISGGQIGVTGGTTPRYQVSYDDGRTWSKTYLLASSGIAELTTYAGGLVPAATGMKATFAAGTLTASLFGALRVPGGAITGDVLYTFLAAGVTVAHVVAGNNTPLTVGVVGSAVTVNVATDGGGAATSTANDVVNFILTDGGAGATAARLLLTAKIVSGGTTVVGAIAATGAPNGGVTYTAKAEYVEVRHVATGNNTAARVDVVNTSTKKQITVTLATDANGVQTTTAAGVVALIAAKAEAVALVSAVATGTGGSIAGALGTFLALPVSVATGDVWKFSTTPPKWNNADLAEAFNTLILNESALTAFSILHVVDYADGTDFLTTHTFLDNAANQKRQFKRAIIEAPYHAAGVSESTWSTTIKNTFPVKGTKVSVTAGEVNMLNSAYGTIDRRNISHPYVARLMICAISELPSHVDCETILGTKNHLDGVQPRTTDGTTTPLWQSEDVLVDLLETENFVTLRTHPGRTGIYVRQGTQYVQSGDDYTYITNARTADVAAALAYDEILRFLNSNALTDPANGELAEIEVQKLEKQIATRLRRKLMGEARQHVSALAVVLDRNTNFAQTGRVTGAVNIVGRTPVTEITLRLGYVPALAET